MAKLCRLKPGASTVVPAIQEEHGDGAADPHAKLCVFRWHWTRVFKATPFNLVAATAWFDSAHQHPQQDFRELHGITKNEWDQRKKDLAKAIRLAGNSAPGPDGLTYRAWKLLGESGLNVL